MKSRLSGGQGSVKIVEQSDVAESVRSVEMRPKRTKVTGYTILILSDNSHTARENANEAKTKFEESFPDTEVKMYYDYHEPLKKMAGHRILAVNRGEKRAT